MPLSVSPVLDCTHPACLPPSVVGDPLAGSSSVLCPVTAQGEGCDPSPSPAVCVHTTTQRGKDGGVCAHVVHMDALVGSSVQRRRTVIDSERERM